MATRLNQVTHRSSETLNQLQEKNQTNIILAQVDSILLRAKNVEKVVEKALDNVAVRVENIQETGGTGIALIGYSEKDAMGKEKTMHSLSHNDTIETILHLNFTVAIKLPASALKGKNRLVFKSFSDGSIFKVNALKSAVISVVIDGERIEKFDEPVRLYFRRNQSVAPKPGKCVYWDFKGNSELGNWSDEGCELHKVHPKNPQESSKEIETENICHGKKRIHTQDIVIDEFFCDHLTHFGELIVDHDDAESQCFTTTDSVLDFVSLWGSVISLAFIFIYIFIAVSIRSELLQRPGQKTKLQLTVNFAILLILFIVGSQMRGLSLTEKAVLGVCTHYFILCNFAWMLNAAILQYRRLVIVFNNKSTKMRVLLSLAAYICPVFPPLLAYSAGGNEVYSKPPLYLPRGLVFYLTIVLPLLLVMFCNVVVFVRISVSLYSKPEVRVHGGTCHNESYVRLKQLVFLFFLFGIAWMFALGQIVVKEALMYIFSYLFVFSISMQGFVYFVLFVVMDKDVRKIWVERYKIAP
ncbi:hypothetical protein B566_EDAN005865 [Ephemera danica]|nr:hypothetical protein B566_EDAN005865 [Ephemera danica]